MMLKLGLQALQQLQSSMQPEKESPAFEAGLCLNSRSKDYRL